MGTIGGPPLANLFLFIKETNWLLIERPLFYARFLDDTFMILQKVFIKEFYESFFDGLKINVTNGNTVNFLDLIIHKDYLTNSIEFSLYVKKTNTFSYLLFNSNHPDFIFKNMPKSLFIRIRRICSHYYDYLYFSNKLIFQLLSRGYDYYLVRKISNVIGGIDRLSLLPYKKKLSYFDKCDIILPIEFDKSLLNLNKTILNSWSYFQSHNDKLNLLNLRLVNSVKINIKSMLIFNKNTQSNSFKCNKCNIDYCNICKYMFEGKYLLLEKYFFLPVLSNVNCRSLNVIYVIFCSLCDFYYVGESESAYIRLNKHLNTIINSKLFEFKFYSEVSEHFKSNIHYIDKHFHFIIIQKDQIDKKIRLNYENDYIHIIDHITGRLMNNYIPNINKLKFLSFKT